MQKPHLLLSKMASGLPLFQFPIIKLSYDGNGKTKPKSDFIKNSI